MRLVIVVLNYFYIYRGRAFTALLYVITYRIVLADVIDQTSRVNKNFGASITWCNESETFRFIKEFYVSLHCIDY